MYSEIDEDKGVDILMAKPFKRTYGRQLLIAIDQLFNALLAGYADETLSARAYRMQSHKKRWTVIRKLIDLVFFWEKDHCFLSYVNELYKRQLPEHYYQRLKTKFSNK